MSIPKKIHYCWFGRGEKSDLIKKCMESWKVHCPDWEIIEWNEDNFDIHLCPYTEKAYKAKKYAYLTDAARLKILYDYGGVYMDTDVELLKPLDDLLEHNAWFGYMRSTNPDGQTLIQVNTGSGFGSSAGNPFILELLNQYLAFDYNHPFEICNILDTNVFLHSWPGFEFNKAIRQEYNGMVILDDLWRYSFHYCENSWKRFYRVKKALHQVKDVLHNFHK